MTLSRFERVQQMSVDEFLETLRAENQLTPAEICEKRCKYFEWNCKHPEHERPLCPYFKKLRGDDDA